jgi:hypothetical protein
MKFLNDVILTGAGADLTAPATVTFSGLDVTTEASAVVINSSGVLSKRALGTSAFTNTYTLPQATSTARGGVELRSNTVQQVVANNVSSSAGRTYGVQLNSADQMVVNVPWTSLTKATTTALGGIIVGGGLSVTAAGVLSVPDASETEDGKMLSSDKTKLDSITVSNIVLKDATETISGAKTFSSTIVGSINGNSATTSERTITSGEISAITAALPKGGGTMTGKITLDGAPTSNLHAATKAYVDSSVIANTDTNVDVSTLETRLGEINSSITIGNGAAVATTTAGALTVSSHLTALTSKIGARNLDWSGANSGNAMVSVQGDVIYHPDTINTTAGKIYMLTSNGGLTLADADATNTSTGLLVVALANLAGKGLLLRGVVRLPTNPDASPGQPIYLKADVELAPTGTATASAPTAGVVRVLGYQLTNSGGTSSIYFNPDNTWVELT